MLNIKESQRINAFGRLGSHIRAMPLWRLTNAAPMYSGIVIRSRKANIISPLVLTLFLKSGVTSNEQRLTSPLAVPVLHPRSLYCIEFQPISGMLLATL